MKKTWLVLCLMLLLPAMLPAQHPGPGGARREALQGEVVRRFMNHVTNQLQLEQSVRGRLEQHLRASGEERRSLAQRSAEVRRQAMDALRDSSTNEADFRRLLSEMTALRQREENLWQADQETLSRILTPRQHVQFVFMWLRFNEQVRELARPQGGPPFGRPRP